MRICREPRNECVQRHQACICAEPFVWRTRPARFRPALTFNVILILLLLVFCSISPPGSTEVCRNHDILRPYSASLLGGTDICRDHNISIFIDHQMGKLCHFGFLVDSFRVMTISECSSQFVVRDARIVSEDCFFQNCRLMEELLSKRFVVSSRTKVTRYHKPKAQEGNL
jgi:hypothetical protein